jgi:hypothetical protein
MCLVQAMAVTPSAKQQAQEKSAEEPWRTMARRETRFAKEASMRSQDQKLSVDKKPFICVMRRRAAAYGLQLLPHSPGRAVTRERLMRQDRPIHVSSAGMV